jgi:hypothetical protein
MKRWQEYLRRARTVMAAAALSVALLVVAVPRTYAYDHDFDDRGRCQERVERAEVRLNQAIWQHGFYSRQAERRRYELAAERQRCFSRNGYWWDGRSHRWRNDRDRDRDDYYRDRR